MSGVWLIARGELFRRRGSLGLLVALVALVGATVLLCVSGARRGESALVRLLEVTRNEHVSIEVGPEYFAAIAGLPQVESVAPASYMFVFPEGLPGDSGLTIASVDGSFGSEVNRPRLVAGAVPLPDRADQVLVNTVVADLLDVGVGDTINMASLSPAQLDRLIGAGEDPGQPAGPRIAVTVVGVGVTAEDLGNRSPILLFTPAFYATFRDVVGHFDDILAVRLEHGDRDLDAFRSGVHSVVPASEGALLEPPDETTREVEDATDLEALSLLAVAAVAALAGLVVIGLVFGRHFGGSEADQPVLTALGMARRQRWLAVTLPAWVAVAVGSIVAVGGAIAASPAMPVGLARRVEPSPGVDADWLVLGVGSIAILVVVAGAVSAISWVATGRISIPRPSVARPARVLQLLMSAGVRPPLMVGARLALDRFGRRSMVTVRSTLIAVVLGSTGVVAAVTFGSGLDRAVHEPATYGWNWDISVGGPFQPEAVELLASELATSPDVVDVTAVHVQPIKLAGLDVQSYELSVHRGSPLVTILEGRAPIGVDEILVGSETLERIGVDIGDQVDAVGLQGGTSRRVVIVGSGVFPEFVHPAVPDSDTASYNDFALADAANLQGFASEAGGEYFGAVLVGWAPGTNTDDAAARLTAGGLELDSPARPTNLDNIARVRLFPVLLALLLAILVGVTIAHALVTATQRQHADLVLLRALGFVTSQVRITLAAYASTLAATGLLIGVPAGIAIGRFSWATVADRIGIDNDPPLPTVAVLVTVLASFTLANLLAIIPSHRTTRSRPSAPTPE